MKVAFSGSHATGKTSSVFDLCARYKKEYSGKTVNSLTEVARECPFPINENAEEKAQMWIFASQLKREVEYENLYDIVVCDRSIVDCIAYTYVVGLYELGEKMKTLIDDYIKTYDKIYFKAIVNNPYLCEDGARSCNKEFQQLVEDNMFSVYKHLGCEVEIV